MLDTTISISLVILIIIGFTYVFRKRKRSFESPLIGVSEENERRHDITSNYIAQDNELEDEINEESTLASQFNIENKYELTYFEDLEQLQGEFEGHLDNYDFEFNFKGNLVAIFPEEQENHNGTKYRLAIFQLKNKRDELVYIKGHMWETSYHLFIDDKNALPRAGVPLRASNRLDSDPEYFDDSKLRIVGLGTQILSTFKVD